MPKSSCLTHMNLYLCIKDIFLQSLKINDDEKLFYITYLYFRFTDYDCRKKRQREFTERTRRSYFKQEVLPQTS